MPKNDHAILPHMKSAKPTLENKIDKLTKLVETIAEDVVGIDARMEKGFGAVAEDVARIDARMDGLATKDQVYALQTQVNSIEQQLRDTKTEVRLGKLEEKVFGSPRR